MNTLLLAALLLIPLTAPAASPDDFELIAPIRGDFTPNEPARVELTEEIVAGSRRDYPDVRVFDDQRQEVPHVIRPQTTGEEERTFDLKILSFSEGSPQEILLELPEGTNFLEAIDIDTGSINFKKTVDVWAGETKENLSLVTKDSIFDFSSQINLRKTSVEFPKTKARFVKLRIQDENSKKSADGKVSLQYDGLSFSASDADAGEFKISGVLGKWGKNEQARFVPMERPIAEPPFKLQENEPDSVLDLGGINLPLHEIEFDVATPYYYRTVELWDSSDPHATIEGYRLVTRATLYRVPGMNKPADTLAVSGVEGRFLKVKIINGSNPPLKVKKIKIRWPKENLYFVPEEGRSYRLFFRNDFSERPRYDLEHAIPNDPETLGRFKALTIGATVNNATYRPQPSKVLQKRTESTTLIGVVLFLTLISGVWVYRLVRETKKT